MVEIFFAESWFENWNTLKHILQELLLSVLKWKLVLDFGCGPGIMTDIMNIHNIDYTRFDPSLEARELYMQHFGKFPDKYISDYDALNNRLYDVVISFDVLEHMKNIEIEKFIKNFQDVDDIFIK